MHLASPQRRRLHAWRGRDVFADGLEQLAYEALRRPVGETDLSGRAADADKFAGSQFLPWREHDAKGREHNIEAGVCEREGLRISFLKGDGQVLDLGALTPAVEKRAHIVR